MLKYFYLLLIVLFLSTCTNSFKYVKEPEILPRNSFLFVEKTLTLYKCIENKCSEDTKKFIASAFIVKSTYAGSYAITAAHVCDTTNITVPIKSTLKAIYTVKRLDGKIFEAKILNYNLSTDVCMLYVKDLVGIKELKIASRGPRPGDKVYNISAPRGIFRPNMVPIIEGRFNGNADGVAYYSLLAAPGSSGSMIINENGELIGMVHSTYMKFPLMTLSVQYDDLKYFINLNFKKYNPFNTYIQALIRDVLKFKTSLFSPN